MVLEVSPITCPLSHLLPPQIIRKQKSKSEQHVEDKPEWPQPQSCGAKAADEGTTASPGGPQASTTFWVSPHAAPAHPDRDPAVCSSEPLSP